MKDEEVLVSLPYPVSLAERFSSLANRVVAFFHERGLSTIAIWGAGKNGRLLQALLAGSDIRIAAVYDDHSSTPLGGMVPSKPPSRFPPAVPVVIAITGHSDVVMDISRRVRRERVPVFRFGDPEPAPIASPPRFRDERIAAFKDIHQGGRCVIIGNGPSLRSVNLDLLKGEVTIGLNKIYLLFEETDFRPTYICCYIQDVIKQCRDEYLKLNMPIFLSHEGEKVIPFGLRDNVYYFGPHKQFLFSLNPMQEICCGFTVTYVALQLAFYMGFHRVILVGIDHNFNYHGNPDQWHVIDKPRPMHFHPEYFAPGQTWQAPNLPMSEAHYRLAKGVFQFHGRDILDATVKGHLHVFDKISLKNALAEPP